MGVAVPNRIVGGVKSISTCACYRGSQGEIASRVVDFRSSLGRGLIHFLCWPKTDSSLSTYRSQDSRAHKEVSHILYQQHQDISSCSPILANLQND